MRKPKPGHGEVKRYGYFINGDAPHIRVHIRDRVLGISTRYRFKSIEQAHAAIHQHKAERPQEIVAKEWLRPRY
jgi:hypothetical protein